MRAFFVVAVLTAITVAHASAEPVGTIEPYGRVLIHAAAVDDDIKVQPSASWVGLKFSAGEEDFRALGQLEWSINPTRGGSLDLGATTGGDFLKLEESSTDPFGQRLGFVGAGMGQFGQLTIGKQNGPHYDIAGMTTDRLNVFGGEGTVVPRRHGRWRRDRARQ